MRTPGRRARIAAAAAFTTAALGMAPVYGPPTALAADVKAPTITTNAAPAFPVGGVIGTSVMVNGDVTWDSYTWEVPVQLKWTVNDNSGEFCEFRLWQLAEEGYSEDPGEYAPTYLSSGRQVTPTTTQYRGSLMDYDGGFGSGGDTHEGWAMRATDCAGNSTTIRIHSGSGPGVLQDDNYFANSEAQDPGRIVYNGSWARTNCACASGGTMRTTSAKNASFTFTRVYERDDHVALVMAKGPKRGKFDVFVDGTKTATVDTYAAANTNRVIVYDKWMPAGSHTVRVVNLATKNRPRIDLDAVLTN